MLLESTIILEKMHITTGLNLQTLDPNFVVRQRKKEFVLNRDQYDEFFQESLPVEKRKLVQGRAKIKFTEYDWRWCLFARASMEHNKRIATRVRRYLKRYIEKCRLKGGILEPQEEFGPDDIELDDAELMGLYRVDFSRLFDEIGSKCKERVMLHVNS
jgi:hypothetical protein